MEHVWEKIEELRAGFDLLKEDRKPIDVFTFLEVDLGLDAIPFDDLATKYRVKDQERVFQEMLAKHGDSFKNPFGWAAAALGQKNPQFRDLEESLGKDHMRVLAQALDGCVFGSVCDHGRVENGHF